MLNLLIWLIAVEAIGLAAFPLCYYLFPRLRDRGYSVSKPLGILLIGYLSWILSVLRVLPSIQLTVVALLIAMGGLSGWYAWSHRREFLDFLARERTAVLVGEAVFLLMFLGWATYRAYDPAINHTEQPMDFSFLNASIRSVYGSPEDPWLSGNSISYYYFGYWMMGVISKLTGIASNISYNLSMALIPALGSAAIFGLVYNMVRGEVGRLRRALVAGMAAVLLLVAVANSEGVLEFMRANGMGAQGFWEWTEVKLNPNDSSSQYMSGLSGSALSQSWHPGEHWWWFRGTRVIDSFDGSRWIDLTIQEFPFFSFMLGDLHPHVMSIPFVLLFIAACWNYLRSPVTVWTKLDIRSYLPILAMGLLLGGLAFTNMWDLPIFASLVVATAALKSYASRGDDMWGLVRDTALFGAVVIGVALLLILPYVLTSTGLVRGIAPVVEATTRPLHMFIVWGLFLVAVTPFILGVFWRTTVREDWARLSIAALLVGFLPYVIWAFLYLEDGGTSGELLRRLVHILPFALLISIAVYSALWLVREDTSSASDMGKIFALVLSALGLLLIMGPELLYVDDAFGGGAERINTVFKLYYQGWIVLAVASGFAIYYWISLRDSASGWKLVLTRLWSGAFVLLLIGAVYYPPAAAASKGDLFHEGATLDGLTYVRGPEYRAIKHLRENAPRESSILEAVGGDYSDFGRVSASTGVPTVLGWPGHELTWRGSGDSFEGRERDVATIYQTEDIEMARNLLAKYGVDYVYVGPRERAKYGVDGLSKFASFMESVFNEDDVTIYRMPR